LRVGGLSPNGATLVLEEGEARVSVVHRAKAKWRVEAGPFAIIVTGTRFVASWSRDRERLELRMEEGKVMVRGPQLAPALELVAKQTLIADVREGRVQIGDSAPAPSTIGGAQPVPSASAVESTQAEASSSGAPGPSKEPPVSWSRRVARGEYKSVLEDAHRMGIETALNTSSLGDLVALADAARYGRRGDLAARALRSVRKRFPGTSASKSAAFMLGRMVDDGGSPGGAIEWYEVYLSESPGGTFAIEAKGRRLSAVFRAQGRKAARPLAEQYLQQHPAGPHAALAREISTP
jgi:hypothetical protein